MTVGGETVALAATEYELLCVLAFEVVRVVTYEMLLRWVWNGRNGANANLVRIFVRNLRRKLGDDAAYRRKIFNERGVGNRMSEPGTPDP